MARLGAALLLASFITTCCVTAVHGGWPGENATSNVNGSTTSSICAHTKENYCKLAIVYAFAVENPEGWQLTNLKASIHSVVTNVMPTTPLVIYVFAFSHQVAGLLNDFSALGLLLPNVKVLPVTMDNWTLPYMAYHGHPRWHYQRAHINYRIMGDWCTSFAPTFARQQGHRYFMKLDDDAFFLGPVGQNLVELFDSKGYLLGTRFVVHDVATVTWGLPELTRYFLVGEKIQPTILFEHCDPPSLEGLYSRLDEEIVRSTLRPNETINLEAMKLPRTGGWDRTILYTNCIMFNVDWWLSPEVSRFVELCRVSGGQAIYRWQEQAVMTMAWQVFVRKDQFVRFNFTYEHEKYSSKYASQFAAAHGGLPVMMKPL